jgi:hypothetical protein
MTPPRRPEALSILFYRLRVCTKVVGPPCKPEARGEMKVVAVLPLEVIELLRGPMQELKLWQIVLLAVWMLGCTLRRAVDQMLNALYALVVHLVMAGEGIETEDIVEEDERDERV